MCNLMSLNATLLECHLVRAQLTSEIGIELLQIALIGLYLLEPFDKPGVSRPSCVFVRVHLRTLAFENDT